MATLKRCPKCKKESVWKLGCCVECNRFNVKLTRHLKDEDEDVVADWTSCRKKRNKRFFGIITMTTASISMHSLEK